MNDKKSLVSSYELKFYRNYCASRSTCTALIIFSSMYVLLTLFNTGTCGGWDLRERVDMYLWFLGGFWSCGMFALAICYTVFYTKIVRCIKYFKIKKELSGIFKLSTSILIITWFSIVFSIPLYFLISVTVYISYDPYQNYSVAGFFLCICFCFGAIGCGFDISLIVLSSVGLSKYSTYGKKYEIFSQYKLIMKGK